MIRGADDQEVADRLHRMQVVTAADYARKRRILWIARIMGLALGAAIGWALFA